MYLTRTRRFHVSSRMTLGCLFFFNVTCGINWILIKRGRYITPILNKIWDYSRYE